MPMSRLPRSDWLGSSRSQFLISRSNLSFGPIAACADVAATAAAALPPRKSRRDKTDMSPSPRLPVLRLPVLARLSRRLALLDRALFHTRLIVIVLSALLVSGTVSAWADY